jgi:hypothetical protein
MNDKDLPPSAVPDWIDQLELSGYAYGQRGSLMRFCWRQAEVLPLGADSPQSGFRPALRVRDSSHASCRVRGVRKNSIFGTSIFGEFKQRRYWVSAPSFSEGFRNRDLSTQGAGAP